MKLSILPVLVVTVLVFCVLLIRKAKRDNVITSTEARFAYGLMVALATWAAIAIAMGLRGIHEQPWLMSAIPLLWQSVVPVAIVMTFFFLSPTLRSTLRSVGDHTPAATLVFIQAIRIGAIGSIMKANAGVITSSFPYWVGIPDFLFGLSAVMVGWMVVRKSISQRVLAMWHLIGALIILVPTFGFTSHWMNEPGFVFIFEFPMVLAPSVVVPILVSLNLFAAWGALRAVEIPIRSHAIIGDLVKCGCRALGSN